METKAMVSSKMRSLFIPSAIVVAAALAGCGGGGAAGGGSENVAVDPRTGRAVTTAGGQEVTQEAHSKWQRASQLFARYEGEGWNNDRCSEVIDVFEDAIEAQEGGRFAEAHYMIGLVASRCNDRDRALSSWNRALEMNSRLCKARAAVGMMHLEANREPQALETFQRALRDDPQCTEAYVSIAAIQRRRGGAQTTEALNNLRRALAIESDYLPAFNQMALLYYEQATAENNATLDLAEVVARQAQLINRDYAPIYNTWGLVKVKRGDIIEALRLFERAAALDRNMFEAYMNFGQITQSFRGYDDARTAFARAVELRADSYDAHIGLGAALRGLNQIPQAKAEYERAIQIDGARPEAYFNLAIMYHDFMSGSVEDLERAKSFYQQFLQRAGNNQRYRETAENVTRRCRQQQQGRRARRRSTDCRPGRMQNLETALDAMRAAAQMQQRQGG